MKTIEERAIEYAGENWLSDGAFFACEDGYIKGATEQQAIDIDKACEWLRENVNKYLYNRGGFEEYIPTCGDTLFDDFIKAMKGE